MSKKNWIMIKRGLSEDAQHRAKMGVNLWLFLHIIDRCDWETGIVYEWRDREEADDMQMDLNTLRHQRQKLEEARYITCKQKQHGQEIIIHEWVNPKNYSGRVLNSRKSEGINELLPSDFQGSNQGSNQVIASVTTLSTRDHVSAITGPEKPPPQ